MKTATRERPILFSAPMVRAILEGRKTQTRRVVKPQPNEYSETDALWRDARADLWRNLRQYTRDCCPYGQSGDRLWVRETWMADAREIAYAATDQPLVGNDKWKPSIHMPRRFSRLTLEITDVRVQRLQEITEADAMAEGLTEFFWDADSARLPQIKPQIEAGQRWWNHVFPNRWRKSSVWDCPIKAFREAWNDINGKRGHAWETNPFVWAITFKRITED